MTETPKLCKTLAVMRRWQNIIMSVTESCYSGLTIFESVCVCACAWVWVGVLRIVMSFLVYYITIQIELLDFIRDTDILKLLGMGFRGEMLSQLKDLMKVTVYQ